MLFLVHTWCTIVVCVLVFFFFQAEDGIRDLVRSRGLGDVYKRQDMRQAGLKVFPQPVAGNPGLFVWRKIPQVDEQEPCLLYTSDAADERSSVDLGGRRIIKKKKKHKNSDIPAL